MVISLSHKPVKQVISPLIHQFPASVSQLAVVVEEVFPSWSSKISSIYYPRMLQVLIRVKQPALQKNKPELLTAPAANLGCAVMQGEISDSHLCKAELDIVNRLMQ